MPKVNCEISEDLHRRAQALGHLFSISKLTRLGLEWAVQHYGSLDPGSIGAATALRATSPIPNSNSAPASDQPVIRSDRSVPSAVTAKPRSLDPIADVLKPWMDPRTKLTWFDVSGALAYLQVDRSVLESILDPKEDLDRSNDDREVLDTAALNRLLDNLPGEKIGSLDHYHALAAWLVQR